MTAQTDNVDRAYKKGEILSLKVAASTTIYKGALVGVVKGTGYAVPAADTANMVIKGVAIEKIVNAGSDGDKLVRVRKTGRYVLTCTGVAITDLGKDVYASDDTTVVKSGQSNDVWVGKIDGVAGTNLAWVDIGEKRNVLTTHDKTLVTEIVDISTAETIYIPIGFAGTITKIKTVLYGTIATANATLTSYINTTAITDGVVTIAYSGSAAGDVDEAVPSALNVVADGDYIKIVGGGESTNAVRVTITIEIEVTV